MKRALLIAGGTLGGLGAVLAITPPQFSSTEKTLGMGIGAGVGITPDASNPTPVATKSATPDPAASKTAKPAATKTSKPSTAASSTATAKPSTSATPATPTTNNVTGTFTGDISSVGSYGGVVVRITVANGKITDAQAIQAPRGENQRYTDRSVPVMRQRTLAAQSANITGVSGASYTSYNFWKSLTSALSKAGL